MVAALAKSQHGVVERGQLMALGLTRHHIDDRLASGLLIPIHRGVFAVGHRRLVPDGYRLAAVLACGPGAVLSHRSAAEAWDLLGLARTRHDVTSMSAGRKHARIDAHRCRLAPADVTVLRGVPITTVERTALDVAEVVTLERTRRLIERAHHLDRFDARAFGGLVERSRGRRGLKRLRRAYELFRPEHADAATRLETLALRLIQRHAIPRPSVNVNLGPYKVDLLWPSARLAVELDSRTYHLTPQNFEPDRRRDADLLAAGYRTLRFTWRHVNDDPAWVVARLRQALTEEPGRGLEPLACSLQESCSTS